MDEGEIIFSDHARKQLEERGIPVDWVKVTVWHPHKLVLDGNRYRAYRQFEKLYL